MPTRPPGVPAAVSVRAEVASGEAVEGGDEHATIQAVYVLVATPSGCHAVYPRQVYFGERE